MDEDREFVFESSTPDDEDTKEMALLGDAQRLRPCEACLEAPAKLRRCTNEYLCEQCRKLPRYRLISRTRAQREFNLTAEEIDAANLPLCTATNPVNHRFRRMVLYRHRDVETLALLLGSLQRSPVRVSRADREEPFSSDAGCPRGYFIPRRSSIL